MALVEMADWFVRTGGVAMRRMRRHVEAVAIPEGWSVAEPLGAAAAPPKPDASRGILGVEFGQLASADLRALMETSGAEGIAVSPWRLLFLLDGDGNGLMQAAETAARCISPALILDASDPRLMVDACPGAPLCGQASVATRDLARRLAGRLAGRALHVSGCSKGCARRGAASVTLVGREGTFDLVLDGNAGDTPVRSGLTEAEVMELLD
jgi:precorrin-3B synthase